MIYQIKSLVSPEPPELDIRLTEEDQFVLTWDRGVLEHSLNLREGSWTIVTGATSPHAIDPDERRGFFRLRY